MVASALDGTFVAYLDGAGAEDQPENLHTDKAARELGFQGGLVYGTSVFAWSVPLILEAAGADWMRDGWIDLHIRRPVYAGEALNMRVQSGDSGAYELSVKGPEGKDRVTATFGRSRGAWVSEHVSSQRTAVEPEPSPRPRITLASAPVGEDLPTLQAHPNDRLGRLFAEAARRVGAGDTFDGRAVQGPASISGRMTWYVHAVWDYAGPALHARSQVQYLDLAGADEPVTVAGHLTEAFERNGNHYAVVDGVIRGADGRKVALARHTTIFKVAPRSGG